MPDHLLSEQLLRYLDGELARSDFRKAKDHLAACWTCQVELEHTKRQISLILAAQTEVFEPSLPPPPNAWPRLEPRLREARVSPSRWNRLFATPTSWFRMPLVYGAAIAVVLMAILVWSPTSRLSAKDVLQKVNAADRQRPALKSHQVAKQRIRVKKVIRNDGNEEAESEVWKALDVTYWGDGLDSLRERYASNGVSSELPLSAAALDSWMLLAENDSSVSRDGNETEVRASANAEGRSHGLEQIRFRVGGDWHVGTLILSFREETFEIVGGQTSVLDQSEVPASVLAQLAPAKSAQTTTPRDAATRNSLLPPATEGTPGVADANDLEMAVRYTLHGLHADLGDGVEVVSTPSGPLTVNAWSAPPELKNQLTVALGSKPDVQLILTAPVGTTPGRSRRIVGTDTPPQPVRDPRLTKVFGTGVAQENYARNLLQGGSIVLARWYALQDLANRWPNDRQLSANAKAQLAAMIHDHVDELKKGASVWCTEIESLLKGLGYVGTPNDSKTRASDWRSATGSGLDAARRADSTIRSLLTVSNQPVALNEALPRLSAAVEELEQSTQLLLANLP